MFENKKEIETNPVTGTPSLQEENLTAPVMPNGQSAVGNKNIKKDKIKNQPKNNVLWAKILVAILVSFLSFLALYKFVIFLNMPKTSILNSIEIVYKDFEKIANDIASDNIYNLLNSRGLEIDSEIKVNLENMQEEYEPIEEIINSHSYVGKTIIDKNDKYINSEVKMMKDETNISTFSFVEENTHGYLKIPTMHEKYVQFNLGGTNLGIIDTIGIISLMSTIKNSMIPDFKEDQFSKEDAVVDINGKYFNTKKNTYTMEASEASIILDSLLNAIKNENDSIYYIASIYGVNVNDLDTKFQELKNKINLSAGSIVTLSAYTDVENEQTVRVEIEYGELVEGRNFTTTLSYDRYDDYKMLKKINMIEENYIEIKGNLSSTFEVNIKYGNNIYTLNNTTQGDSKVGTVKILDIKLNILTLTGNYTYTLKNTSSKAYSSSATLELITHENNEDSTFKLNLSSSINSNISIDKPSLGSTDTVEEFKRIKNTRSLKASIIDSIAKINDSTIAPSVVDNINDQNDQLPPEDGENENSGNTGNEENLDPTIPTE